MKTKVLKLFYAMAMLFSMGFAAKAAEPVKDTTFFRHIYDEYVKDKNFTSMMMDSKMLGISSGASSLNGNIESIYVINSENHDQKFIKNIEGYVLFRNMDLIGQKSEGGKLSSFYMKKSADGKSEFVLCSDDDASYSVIRIYGRFDIDDISRMSEMVP